MTNDLKNLLEQAKRRVDSMTQEEYSAMLEKQRESYVRAELAIGLDEEEAAYRKALNEDKNA